MALLHQSGNGHWMGSLDRLCAGLTAKIFGLQEENINISQPQGKTTNWGNWMGYHRKKERGIIWTKRERNREGGCSPL